MILPAMKKEINLRLIRRIVVLSLLAVILSVGCSLYLELRQLNRTLLLYSQKESELFTALVAQSLETQDEGSLTELGDHIDSALAHTSFIQIEILDPQLSALVAGSSAGTEAVRQKIADSGITLPPSGRPDGVRFIFNKRVYFISLLPIFDSNTKVTGYMSGVYRVSLSDTRQIINRLLLSGGMVAGSVLACSCLLYLGFLLLNNRIIRTAGKLRKTNIFLLKKLGASLAKSDSMDPDHGFRVVIYATRLAEEAGLPREEIRRLINGAFLHDLGMLPISASVLLKMDSLNPDEFATVKDHPKTGYSSVRKMGWLRQGCEIIRCHHEKYDGSGYPDGIRHEKIPVTARIFSIADSFDALTSGRPYRDALQPSEALAVLEQESGLQFDPVLLATFIKVAPQLHRRLTAFTPVELESELDRVLKKYIRF